ncbi:hypothetical protein CWR48_04950 [Oceanobacillus arenosus]|uniref:Uncharacterized protein n=2 Tax=Oceanobacillus arenosus TaxID=1229153 RepID=A0A3D8PZA2_9BACI|nr:hypothetical protein CWR48_04950 [Oceanobacillus arenosus]
MRDSPRARAMNLAVDAFIEKTEDAGYCQHAILGPTLMKFGYDLQIPENMMLKKELDEDYHIDMSDYQQAIEYSARIFESTVQAINEGLMTNR